ncbi:MAG: hypothetical protein DME26_02735 [Verrucomicrobia bacterium]|nr:MAG: hypothetical protein DME26_02735 [Verrucomicrobiota bacterium]
MPSVLETPTVTPSLLLQQKIQAVRRKQVGVSAGTGLAILVCAIVLLLGAQMLSDWWLDLSWAARAAVLAFNIGIFGYLAFQHVLLPVIKKPDDDAVALIAEKALPQFHSRLIAAIQLARPGGVTPGESSALAQAMIEETEELAEPIEFEKIIKTDRLKTPVPRKTHIAGVTGNLVVGRGDSVTIMVVANGLLPSRGRLFLKSARRSQEFQLEPDKDTRGKFSRTIENVQESFHYVAQVNDGLSGTYRVEVIPRPTIASIQAEQVYPPYTKLGAVKRALGDLTLLAGSRLILKAKATKDLQRATVKLAGLDQDVPMLINPQALKDLSAEIQIPAKGMNGFSIDMLDTHGMASHDTAVYRVDVIPDKVPAAKITYPDRKEELITKHATLIVGFEIVDDFQITKARLRYKIGTDEKSAENAIELDLAGERPQRLRRRHEWKIGAFNPLPPEGTSIEFWVEAEDNNDVTGPGVGSSEHQIAKVVSEDEKRADLLNRAGDYLGSIGDVATDQEKLNQSLGALILEKIGPR